MSGKGIKRLIVVDPALARKGGHHTGLALLIATSKESDVDVTFLSHRNISVSLKQTLESYGCIVKPIFDFNFYEIFEKELTLNQANAYVLNAAKEYADVIRQMCEERSRGRLNFFHPSMSWEHAYALSLALNTIGYDTDMSHLICAMFNPGVSYSGVTLDCQRKLNFEISFRALLSSARVKLFASDMELASIYKTLLCHQSDVPVHPCYLSRWVNPVKEAAGRANHNSTDEEAEIILYMGDAKSDKGFLELPDLVSQVLAATADDQKLYIQFNIPWPDPELELVAEKLRCCALNSNRIILREGFISQCEVGRRLFSAKLFVFNYCNQHYQHKSSGFLWLVIWYQTPVYFFGRSWLSREATRLGAKVLGQGGSMESFLAAIKSPYERYAVNTSSCGYYFNLLYRDIWDWLKYVGHSK